MITRRKAALATASIGGLWLLPRKPAFAVSASKLIDDSNAALINLYQIEPKAVKLGNLAKGILVFPKIYKAGFIVGAETGDGTFYQNGQATSFYNISSASYGLQAGVQSYSYALFFMNNAAVNYLSASNGWSVGAGPSVVVLDQGAARSFTSSTLTQDVYAIPFGQQGLMAGLGLQGSKITHFNPGS